MDITSLYTVILKGEGLLALKYFLIYPLPSLEKLLCLAELVLTLHSSALLAAKGPFNIE